MSSPAHSAHSAASQLRDFTTDRRLALLIAMACVVGTMGAGSAWVLLRLIELATNIAYFGRFSIEPVSIIEQAQHPIAILIPVIGCLIIGLMARYGSEKIRGHGIPEAIEAILIGQSRIHPKVALLKPLSSAISIGSGGPFGAEGPIIMTGGALGSLFAQLFELSNGERKALLVAGAAAGMSATFGTPVAAILLAVELLLFEWKPRSFVPVAVASAVAAAWRPYLLGPGPLFPMEQTAALSPEMLLLCAVFGVVAAVASGILTAMVYACEDGFQRLPIHWMWWPAIGGVAIGVGGLIEPHALAVGYDNIARLLHGQMSTGESVRLLVVKSIIWAVALGSGTSGGVLAPLLIMGGALGAVAANFLPGTDPGFWALIGMAAMMGGTMRAPLTSMIFAVELTHDLGALLPLAIACALAHGTTAVLLKRSILTEKVARKGHHLVREYAVDPFETVRVGRVMASPADTLPATMRVADAVEFFTGEDAPRRHKSYPVVGSDGQLVGMLTRADILRWTVQGWSEEETLGTRAGTRPLFFGYDDEPVGHLADRMAAADIGRVPIVRRDDSVVVGLVARRDLLRARTEDNNEQTRERTRLLPRRKPSPEEAAIGNADAG